MNFKNVFAGIATVLILTACSSGTVGGASPDGDNYATSIDYNSTMLAMRVKVSDLRTRRADNLLQVGVDLHNHWDSTLDFQYKFKFFDKDGFEVSPDSRSWIPITITGNETAQVQAVSPNPTATTFKIYVQD
jgi:uncharacterized protein YcfL